MSKSRMSKPRICELLNLEVGELFTVRLGDGISEDQSVYAINGVGNIQEKVAFDRFEDVDGWFACFIVNHPGRVYRFPGIRQGDIDLLVSLGAKWVSRDPSLSECVVKLWAHQPYLSESKNNCGNRYYLTSDGPIGTLPYSLFPYLKTGDCLNVGDENDL